MGENAEMLISGTCCEHCGEFIGNEAGYPQTCDDCYHELAVAEVEEEFEQK